MIILMFVNVPECAAIHPVAVEMEQQLCAKRVPDLADTSAFILQCR